LAAPAAQVIRGGEIITLDGKLLVPGDLVKLETGKRIAADIRLTESTDLSSEEAPLTGLFLSLLFLQLDPFFSLQFFPL
jgi:Ca2+-transporting ATPase